MAPDCSSAVSAWAVAESASGFAEVAAAGPATAAGDAMAEAGESCCMSASTEANVSSSLRRLSWLIDAGIARPACSLLVELDCCRAVSSAPSAATSVCDGSTAASPGSLAMLLAAAPSAADSAGFGSGALVAGVGVTTSVAEAERTSDAICCCCSRCCSSEASGGEMSETDEET